MAGLVWAKQLLAQSYSYSSASPIFYENGETFGYYKSGGEIHTVKLNRTYVDRDNDGFEDCGYLGSNTCEIVYTNAETFTWYSGDMVCDQEGSLGEHWWGADHYHNNTVLGANDTGPAFVEVEPGIWESVSLGLASLLGSPITIITGILHTALSLRRILQAS